MKKQSINNRNSMVMANIAEIDSILTKARNRLADESLGANEKRKIRGYIKRLVRLEYELLEMTSTRNATDGISI